MSARSIPYTLTGTVSLEGSGGRTHLVAESGEGMREPIDYPIEGLRAQEDSINFSFAPIGFRLQGRCISSDRLEGRFAVPHPPYDSIVGDWQARRKSGANE